MEYQAAAAPQQDANEEHPGASAPGVAPTPQAVVEEIVNNEEAQAAPDSEQGHGESQSNEEQQQQQDNQPQQQDIQPQQLVVGIEHQIPHIAPDGAQPADHTMAGVMQHFDPSQLIGVPPGLAPLQQEDHDLTGNGKFKPIDLESLSPKSRQRVLRNRQAATRSKAKKKQQYQLLKDKKMALAAEIEQMEGQLAATQQRVAQLHADNKALLDACKCPKDYPRE